MESEDAGAGTTYVQAGVSAGGASPGGRRLGRRRRRLGRRRVTPGAWCRRAWFAAFLARGPSSPERQRGRRVVGSVPGRRPAEEAAQGDEGLRGAGTLARARERRRTDRPLAHGERAERPRSWSSVRGRLGRHDSRLRSGSSGAGRQRRRRSGFLPRLRCGRGDGQLTRRETGLDSASGGTRVGGP